MEPLENMRFARHITNMNAPKLGDLGGACDSGHAHYSGEKRRHHGGEAGPYYRGGAGRYCGGAAEAPRRRSGRYCGGEAGATAVAKRPLRR